ncbi:MAG TPA: sensor histidine kinase N-terminal domain-containing protein [Pseudorhodoferax sp.]|nr:sensor histidine kinase N-terminal domain-containing protein [Pseudorhodoferax sp.]
MASEAPAPSLRRALLAWLVLPLVVLVPLAAALLYLLAVQPAMDSLDRALTDTTVALADILEERDGRAVLPLSEQTARALRADLVDEVVFAVGDARGGLLAGERLLLDLQPAVARGEWRFFDGRLRGQAMRVVAHGAPCGAQVCTILVAESLGKRNAAARAVALAALGVSLLLAACLAGLARVAVWRGLRPLQQASQALEQRSLQQLDPLPLERLPREVAFFGTALNALFARLRAAAGAQRSFLDDASHQLRTPLAVLLSESAQALQQPHSPELGQHLQRLHAAAERSAHLSHQLLMLARAEGTALALHATRAQLDLAQLVTESAPDWVRPALAAGQDLGFALQSVPVRGEAWLLRELVANLVHNAGQHAGRGAQVTVRTRTEDGQAVLEVEDDGPGMAEDDRARAWDRFHRGRGAHGPGTGLGLSIVQHIAQLHGGRAELAPGPAGYGLRVRVLLPLATAA